MMLPCIDSVVCISGVVEFHEGERGSPPVLEVDKLNLSVLVEQVLDVLVPNIWREVADVDASLVFRHPWAGGVLIYALLTTVGRPLVQVSPFCLVSIFSGIYFILHLKM